MKYTSDADRHRQPQQESAAKVTKLKAAKLKTAPFLSIKWQKHGRGC